MCTLGRSIAMKSEARGEEKGIIIGEERANRSAAIRLFQLKRPVEEIAIALNESIETVHKWLDETN